MRKIVHAQPCFPFNVFSEQKVIREYRAKYDSIDRFLDEHPEILNVVHKDLRRCGSSKGRGASYSSEQVLRMSIVMIIEDLPYRETVIRIADSDFLLNFTRIGMGKVMSFNQLCTAFKHIQASTWQKINAIVLDAAQRSGKITAERLRVDSTVCESNIHYPTDSSLLWDVYRVHRRYYSADRCYSTSKLRSQ